MKFVKSIILAIFVALSFSAVAGEKMGLSVYRGSDGLIAQPSIESAKQMRDHAKEVGHIDLWLTLNYNYNLYPDQMTAEELEIQRLEVEAGFAAILNPLIAQGRAKHPVSGPLMRGPSCAVRLTMVGLNKILDDGMIIQIVAMSVNGSD